MNFIRSVFTVTIIISSLFLFLVGCTGTGPTNITSSEDFPAETPTVVSNVSQTATPTTTTISAEVRPGNTVTSESTPLPSTQTATFASQSTITETPAPISTPLGNSLEQEIRWLYKTNNGCQLPCWWGIIPGKTQWKVVQEFLTRLDADIYETKTSEETYYGALVPLPIDIFAANYVELGFIVRDELVVRIFTEVSIGDTPSDYLVPYTLPTLLETYGPPTEVWLYTYNSPFEYDDLPFIVVLFYPEQGFTALLSDNGVRQEDTVLGCPQKEPIKFLSLRTTGSNITFNEEIRGTSALDGDYLSLGEATSMNIATFYETFKNPNNTTCLETPANLWP